MKNVIKDAAAAPAAKAKVQFAAERRGRRFTIVVVVTAIITAAITAYLLFADVDRLTVGVLVIVHMMGLMLLRVPVAVSMIASSILGLFVLVGSNGVGGSLETTAFQTFASWSLSIIPMFVLMGIAMARSGLTSSAYTVAQKWLGRLPGGLAIATNYASAGLAATSGSTMGIAYAVGRVAIPEMVRSGYRPSLAMGSVAMSGTLGQIIPPSILLVIYAGVAQTPVGPQLVAGIIPGIVLAMLFSVTILVWAMISPSAAPRSTVIYRWADKLLSLFSLTPLALIVLVVIGGIYWGVFTATEAGAFGAFVTLILGTAAVIVRTQRARKAGASGASIGKALGTFYSSSMLETISAVGAVFFLLIGVNLLTRVMALSGLAQAVADAVVDLGFNKIGFLLFLIIVYLILGFFLDTLAMMLLTIPVFLAPLVALDVDLIWFGVFLVVLAEIDLVAPPLGMLNFIVLNIAQTSLKAMGLRVKIGIGDVFRGVTPFIAATVLFLVALIIFPEIATWLPSISGSK